MVSCEDCLGLAKEVKDNRQRPVIKCLLCSKNEMEVRKFANNGRIPLPCGVRVDGKDRLSNVVDHLFSPAHNEALRLKQLDELWNNSSDSHPWIKVRKKCKAETLEILLRLAVDVYNDCRTKRSVHAIAIQVFGCTQQPFIACVSKRMMGCRVCFLRQAWLVVSIPRFCILCRNERYNWSA